MTLPSWLFSPEIWIFFWITVAALALWAVWTGSRQWDRFEELLDLFDQDAYDRNDAK